MTNPAPGVNLDPSRFDAPEILKKLGSSRKLVELKGVAVSGVAVSGVAVSGVALSGVAVSITISATAYSDWGRLGSRQFDLGVKPRFSKKLPLDFLYLRFCPNRCHPLLVMPARLRQNVFI
jgi:hypothetical protein